VSLVVQGPQIIERKAKDKKWITREGVPLVQIAQSCPVAGGVASCIQSVISVEFQGHKVRKHTLRVVKTFIAPGSETIPARPSRFDARMISSSNLDASF